jgi:hypothetical protein
LHEKELNKATKWMVFNLGLEMVNSQIYKDVILFLIFITTIIKFENIKINSNF